MCDPILTDDNYMHCIDYENIRVRMNWKDIIPMDLIKHYVILIDGFVRLEFERTSYHYFPNTCPEKMDKSWI